MIKGSTYRSKNPTTKQAINELYHTPASLVWRLLEHETFSNCLEPAAGQGAIVRAANHMPERCHMVKFSDITTGDNFLDCDGWSGDVLTNFPFSKWDALVMHAKKVVAGKICVLGCLNYLGCHGRNTSGIWDGLSDIYIFDRYVDYRTPQREDGHFHVGALCTGWFVWRPRHMWPHEVHVLDVSEYATLGGYQAVQSDLDIDKAIASAERKLSKLKSLKGV